MRINRTTPIRMMNETIVPLSPAEVWPVLADIARYPQWWPRSLFVRLRHANPELIGTEFTIRPYGWRAFCCRVVSFEEPVRICLQYDGVYMGGVAEWRLEPAGQGTRVIYDMDAVVKDLLVTVFGAVIDLKSVHSYSMRGIFRNLNQQLFR
jgi:uncharacterized protein YndB with AHSA1/START domain